MAEHSTIEWTDATWNPIRARNRKTGKIGWHCEHATTGCEFCYAEGFNKRLGTGLPFKPGHRADIEIFLDEKMLLAPLRWRQPRMIFVCSMTDIFADFVTDEWLDRMFAVMALCPQHTFQLLTKRPGRMRRYCAEMPANLSTQVLTLLHQGLGDRRAPAIWPLPNVWLGTSAERQQEWDERKEHLKATPAAVRFISLEPLLGDIRILGDLMDGIDPGRCANCDRGHGFTRCPNTGGIAPHRAEKCTDFKRQNFAIHWVIVGGESGRNARPMHPDWARSLRDQCLAAGVPFHFKQQGSWQTVVDRDRDDADWRADYTVVRHKPGYRIVNLAGGFGFHGERVHLMRRVSKKRAGRLLDGREHNAFPVSSPPSQGAAA